MKLLPVLLMVALATAAFGQDPKPAKNPKDTMCVKQKDGTYKCLASGKIEKEPCCDLGNDPTPTPKPKKK